MFRTLFRLLNMLHTLLLLGVLSQEVYVTIPLWPTLSWITLHKEKFDPT